MEVLLFVEAADCEQGTASNATSSTDDRNVSELAIMWYTGTWARPPIRPEYSGKVTHFSIR